MTNTALHTRIIDSKADWELFLTKRPEANFLQSWNWGVFHQLLGKKTFSVGLFKGDEQVGAAMTVKEVAKRGKYLTVAGGPLLDWQDLEHVSAMCEALKQLAQQEACQFIRIRPQAVDSPELRQVVM